jgi:hypothetical protein
MKDKVAALRLRGKSYREIDFLLGLPLGKSWIIHNRERANANTRDSVRRYYARGSIALCDMQPSKK